MRIGSHRVPDAEIQGALFDVDGTLIDSMRNFYPSWNACGEEFGFGAEIMDEKEFYSFGGWPLQDIVRELHRRRKGSEASDEFVTKFIQRKKQIHAQREKKYGPPGIIHPVVDIARHYVEAGIPVIAATSGLREHVEAHLQFNGLMDIFPSNMIICAADLEPGCGKPKPDIFLAAAKRIGADPTKCVAYEDAEAGLQAAYTAGCEVVDVRHLDGYPAPPALKEIINQQKHRPWLKPSPSTCSMGGLVTDDAEDDD
mmetsp:Transcript_11712/g.14606  ORF Transcript_11712/g.14606 Transcript_11712/m.14606 type:complete len:255 (-) Transcript_11712:1148-1912(-)|eukprot:CAMPEP_0197337864 /NCGR_PEP_ID=MMETSP0892-20130614/39726_1 /TAXON_ID=44058 ORGANISM="Aureoumbra lagunensis, Strain CCMP1510" /NCGR_SAMPLE_ID=MMETSP0892 /ASSEMBLY_ACC=CAM_ASM_000538 /LENGTH=254 /DNA_ID=CAMNT_0042840931 /DNA_START=13 /DNA_END=777 /DNA_ORIENTATION=+